MAELETIRRVRVEGSVSGMDNVVVALRQVDQAQTAVGASAAAMGTSTDTNARKVTSTAGAFDRLMQSLEPTLRAQTAFERGQRTVNSALEQSVASTDKAARAMQLLDDRLSGIGDRMVLRAQQIGKAFNEDLVASFAGSGKSASASGSIFAAEFDRLEEIARLKAMQAGQTFRSGIDAGFAGTGKRASDSASVFEAADRDAAALRAQIDPLGVAQARLNLEMSRYAELAASGHISTTELAQAQALVQTRFTNSAASLEKFGAVSNRTRGQLQQLSFQVNDVVSGLAMGQSPFMILTQQAGQFVQVAQMGEGGISGTFAKITASIAAMATPLNIAIAGVVALGAGVAAYALATRNDLPSADDALKLHADLIRQIKGRYGEAAIAAGNYQRESQALTGAGLMSDAATLRGNLQREAGYLENRLVDINAVSAGAPAGTLYEQFAPFQAAFDRFQQSVKSGTPDFRTLREEIASGIASESVTSNVRALGNEFLDLTKTGDGLQRSLSETTGTIDKFARDALNAANNVIALNKAFGDLRDIARIAPTDAESAAAAYRRGLSLAATPGERSSLEAEFLAAQDRIAGANMPTPRSRPNLADYDPATGKSGDQSTKKLTADANAYRDLVHSTRARIDALKVEIDTLGMGAAKMAAYRLEQDLISKATEKGRTATEAQRLEIEKLATAYGALVEQQQRTAFSKNLAFDAAQIGRSPVEQDVANSMRGIYGDDYLKHMQDFEAQQIRNNAAMKDMVAFRSDVVGGFFHDLTSGLREGKNGFEALADAAQNALDKIVDKLTNLAIDDLLASLFPGADGKQVSGTGNFVSALLGRALPTGKVANDNTVAAIASSIVPSGIGSDTAGTAAGGSFSYRAGIGKIFNTQLTDILKTAALESGVDAQVISGLRPGDPRFHGKNMAVDTQLFDKLGKAIPNYQSGEGFREYEKFAQAARQVQMEKYPELADKFRWGGYFSGPKGKYGANDAMHFDLGGDKVGMGGGSWDTGLTATQRDYFPDANSVGMASQAAGRSLKDMSDAATATAKATSGLGGSFNQLGDGLSSAASKLGSGGGAGGGMGWLASIFSWNHGATGLLYADGGYTGHGGRNQPAGIVHRGEVVWSQSDIARAGGVGVVEGMRRGLRGYADGGVVDMMAFARQRQGAATSAAPVSIVVNNNSQAKVTTTETTGADGSREIQFQMEDMVADAQGRYGSSAERGLRARGVKPPTRKIG